MSVIESYVAHMKPYEREGQTEPLNQSLTFLLWNTFPCSMNSDEGARLREILAEAVRRSRGFRKPAWTAETSMQGPAETSKDQ